MKKIVLMAWVMMMTVSGCTAGVQSESYVLTSATDDVVTEKRSVGEFSGVSLIGSCKVVCTQGNGTSVVVEAPKETAGRLLTEVKNGVLTISKKKIAGVRVIGYDKADGRTTVYVTLPKLEHISLVGSGDIVVKGKVSGAERLDIKLSGSGDIELDDVSTKFFNMTLAGSGDIKAGNIMSRQTQMQVAGSGDIRVKHVESDGVKASVAGSGDISVGDVKASLVTATATGSGDIKIAGSTARYVKTRNGSGSIQDGKLKYVKIEQVGGWKSTPDSPASPNGIEALP